MDNTMENTKDNPIYELVELFDGNLRKYWRSISSSGNSSRLKTTMAKDLQDSSYEGNPIVVKSYKLENVDPEDEDFDSFIQAIDAAFWRVGNKFIPNSRTGKWYWRTRRNRTLNLVRGSSDVFQKVFDVFHHLPQSDYFIIMSGENKGYSVTFRFRKNPRSVFLDFIVKEIDSDTSVVEESYKYRNRRFLTEGFSNAQIRKAIDFFERELFNAIGFYDGLDKKEAIHALQNSSYPFDDAFYSTYYQFAKEFNDKNHDLVEIARDAFDKKYKLGKYGKRRFGKTSL